MSLIRSFWKQFLVYGLGIVLVRAVSFMLLPLYTNQFTTEEAGYIYLMFTFIAFAQVFYNHGMDSAFLKFVAQKDENKMSTPMLSNFLMDKNKSNENQIGRELFRGHLTKRKPHIAHPQPPTTFNLIEEPDNGLTPN